MRGQCSFTYVSRSGKSRSALVVHLFTQKGKETTLPFFFVLFEKIMSIISLFCEHFTHWLFMIRWILSLLHSSDNIYFYISQRVCVRDWKIQTFFFLPHQLSILCISFLTLSLYIYIFASESSIPVSSAFKHTQPRKKTMNLNNKTTLGKTSQRSVLSLTSPTKLNIIASLASSSSKVTIGTSDSPIDWKAHSSRIQKTNSLQRSKSYNINNSRRLTRQDSILGSRSTQNHNDDNNNNSVTTSKETENTRISVFSRPQISNMTAPPLLKRNSSFFKDDSNSKLSSSLATPLNSGTSLASSFSSSHDLEETMGLKTDRFIPIFQSNSQNKIDTNTLKEEQPPPTASPTTHLRAQTKTIFKQSVAEACGLNMQQRILEYLPQPPVASFNRKSYRIKNRTHYNYQQDKQQQEQQLSRELIKLRKINTNPERILDAPGYVDDFYLNVLAWSSNNIMAIGLDTAVYLWNATSGDVSLLVDFNTTAVSSIVWSDDAIHLSIGKDDGNTEIWDTDSMSLVRTMRSHLGVRIGSLSWLDTLVAAGSRSGEIQINDVRVKEHVVSTFEGHQGEVCGLSYKNDGLQLASGGNDNTVMIWDTRTSIPLWEKRTHNAAVKALSWCPYTPNILASGGGQNDKYIHFWNSTTGNKLGSINTGSQVSSLHWGQSYNSNGSMNREIVATGGNPDNSISIYNFDTKFKVAEIVKAHESRICCSQLSPDGTTLATVGGDENLKFFKIFEPRRTLKKRNKGSALVDDAITMLRPSTKNDNFSENSVKTSQEMSSESASGSQSTSYLIR